MSLRTPPAVRTPWRSRAQSRSARNEEGFSLIELIIVALVLPIVIGAITMALFSIFTLQTNTSSRISNSADAQVVSSNFETDVQAATMIIAPSGGAPSGQNPATCGTGTEVMSLELGSAQTVVSYVEVASGASPVTYSLVRNVCKNGNTTTPVSSMTISNNVPLGQVANVSCAATLSTALTKNTSYGILNVSAIPAAVASTDRIVVGTGSTTQTFVPTTTIVGSTTITVAAQLANAAYPIGTQVVDSNWANSNCGASTAWISTSGVTGVTFAVTEPVTAKGSDPYAYTLTALPRASGPPNPATSVASPTATKCNFADTGSGTYASSLCFVDFTPYAAPTSGCQGMSATIPGTSYTMTFCLSVSGGPVHSAVFPTYAQAFLGNNGFYTGVGGGPALYQSNSGTTTTVTINSIQLANANGTPATGWELVTGDAETTDANESITWTSNQNLSLLPNTPTSPVGDACSYPTSPLGLSGTGTQTVVCASSTSDTTSARTGTVMLVAPAPTTLTVTLVGTGLEAMFLGILLPS